MAYSYSEPSNRFGSNAIDAIPVLKYPELCNCIYCLIYSKTKFCDECKKIFCICHIENHMCFREVVAAATTVVSKSYGESTEAVTL